MTRDDEPEERLFAAVVLPFEPKRLREMSHENQGVFCDCPDCLRDWVVAMALDAGEAAERLKSQGGESKFSAHHEALFAMIGGFADYFMSAEQTQADPDHARQIAHGWLDNAIDFAITRSAAAAENKKAKMN